MAPYKKNDDTKTRGEEKKSKNLSLLDDDSPEYEAVEHTRHNTHSRPHIQPYDDSRLTSPADPDRREYNVEAILHWDAVDRMMAEAREAAAAAKRPAVTPPPPPPDYDTTEYFSKIDVMMAKIANGTIEDDDEPEKPSIARAIGSKVSGALGHFKKTTRNVFSGQARRDSSHPESRVDGHYSELSSFFEKQSTKSKKLDGR